MANLDEKTIHIIADWMESIGYRFERDRDGFWFEEYLTDHRLCEIMELMDKYAKHVLTDKLTTAMRKVGTE